MTLQVLRDCATVIQDAVAVAGAFPNSEVAVCRLAHDVVGAIRSRNLADLRTLAADIQNFRDTITAESGDNAALNKFSADVQQLVTDFSS